jgi:hypothetical protein
MNRRGTCVDQFRLPLVLLAATGATTAAMHVMATELEMPATPRAQVEHAAATTSLGPFDGYLFLDVDGRPLPFQSDEDIEDYLRSAKVVSLEKIPVGVTSPRKTLLSLGDLRVHAVFKHLDEKKKMVRDPTATGHAKLYLNWRDSYIYDVAAYHVDRLLHFDRVPPIVLRKVKHQDGSLQIWLEGTITEKTRRNESIKPPDIARFHQQRSTMHVFDNLVANRDANLGNTLIDGNWRLWYIDCTRCFGLSTDLLYPEMVTHCERGVWKALRELDGDAAKQALSPYLSSGEIDALLVRRDKLVEHVQSRIDELSEDLVLFDQRPPTVRAPWVGD